MADYLVTCIRRDGCDPNYTIDGIGGPGFGYLSVGQALGWIDAGHTFHTYFSGVRAEVIASGNALLGRRWLTTTADGLLGNNLLRLDECPLS